MRLFDTHAHLDSDQLYENASQIVDDAMQTGLVGITTIATTVASSQRCLELADRFASVYASVGIHPNKCQSVSDLDWATIVDCCKHPKAVAIGETGLDRYWDHCPIDIQKTWFRKHIELSIETGRPIVVHMRDCEKDILEILSEYSDAPINGIMHSYAGSWKTAKRCLDFGMHISFAGMVTFKKSNQLRQLAAKVPLERLLIETDSPFLSPHPRRSQRPNTPAMIRHTAECLSDVFDISLEELSDLTTKNAFRVFRIN